MASGQVVGKAGDGSNPSVASEPVPDPPPADATAPEHEPSEAESVQAEYDGKPSSLPPAEESTAADSVQAPTDVPSSASH